MSLSNPILLALLYRAVLGKSPHSGHDSQKLHVSGGSTFSPLLIWLFCREALRIKGFRASISPYTLLMLTLC